MNRFWNVAIVLTLTAGGCKNGGSPAAKEPLQPKEAPPPSVAAEPTKDEPPDLQIPVAGQEDRWLFVEKSREGAPGGHATGSFDPKRNKISVRTTNVQAFAVETSLIAVDWTKPVVISIDGRNSELRQRERTLLHFVRAPHGEWIVED